MKPLEWVSGVFGYRKHKLTFGPNSTFTTSMSEVFMPEYTSVQAAFEGTFSSYGPLVEVLYSGGLDSEAVIISCLQRKKSVVANTVRLLYRGAPINVHDLYYADKFCIAHNIGHRYLDLHIEAFYGNGDHLPYLLPYNINTPNVAAMFWAIEQCTDFPVIGGDYSWPQLENKVYSPHRHSFNCFDDFMRKKSISGVGNMLSHNPDSNRKLIKEHLNVYTNHTDTNFKEKIFENLGFGTLERRHKSFGWETANMIGYDWRPVILDLNSRTTPVTSVIKWGPKFGTLIGAEPGENSKF